MPSFRDLLDRHATLLVLDASSRTVRAGVFRRSAPARWHAEDGDAGTALFLDVRALDVRLDAVDAFVFCDGPGSILGIRTSAMAIRTWCGLRPRPVYAYGSLALVAHAHAEPAVRVIADARRGAWHEFTRALGLRRVKAGELQTPAVTPAGFRHWMPLPPATVEADYDVPRLLEATDTVPLLREVEHPDAFLHEEPAYAAWSPAVHQAPTR